ncbi:uncharacterized protein MYCGRDRAFT_95952 [Zymoseptoria tritici IPO323]|uniref:Uncharacterized protein n=1 Tax=Zymoseptoria tritici (strain CBS 115943 / IPO323) TaxID=336722 RepID=F9XKD6_ZYMTI|nr:uncharacterized protein MYCGRDRAFT_95952 [Zymoseptoria tritici IPO323]EGP84506.1 hypothetical protein MYCGRDRAFT_95952 [Zymoseptoria tritici IPO323]
MTDQDADYQAYLQSFGYNPQSPPANETPMQPFTDEQFAQCVKDLTGLEFSPLPTEQHAGISNQHDPMHNQSSANILPDEQMIDPRLGHNDAGEAHAQPSNGSVLTYNTGRFEDVLPEDDLSWVLRTPPPYTVPACPDIPELIEAANSAVEQNTGPGHESLNDLSQCSICGWLFDVHAPGCGVEATQHLIDAVLGGSTDAGQVLIDEFMDGQVEVQTRGTKRRRESSSPPSASKPTQQTAESSTARPIKRMKAPHTFAGPLIPAPATGIYTNKFHSTADARGYLVNGSRSADHSGNASKIHKYATMVMDACLATLPVSSANAHQNQISEAVHNALRLAPSRVEAQVYVFTMGFLDRVTGNTNWVAKGIRPEETQPVIRLVQRLMVDKSLALDVVTGRAEKDLIGLMKAMRTGA